MSRYVTVKELYDYAQDNELPLFPTETGLEFWGLYDEEEEAQVLFDKRFVTLYKRFMYFNYEVPNNPTQDDILHALLDFKFNVYSFFVTNIRKFTELAHIEGAEFDLDVLLGNLNYTKTTNGHIVDDDTLTSGSRSDSTSESMGAQSNNVEGQVAAFDTTTYSPKDKTIESIGAKTNSISNTKGQQVDDVDRDRTIHEGVTFVGKDSDTPMSTLIESNMKLWKLYSYWDYILKEISREFLIV